MYWNTTVGCKHLYAGYTVCRLMRVRWNQRSWTGLASENFSWTPFISSLHWTCTKPWVLKPGTNRVMSSESERGVEVLMQYTNFLWSRSPILLYCSVVWSTLQTGFSTKQGLNGSKMVTTFCSKLLQRNRSLCIHSSFFSLYWTCTKLLKRGLSWTVTKVYCYTLISYTQAAIWWSWHCQWKSRSWSPWGTFLCQRCFKKHFGTQ